jgi:hypothetical protein
MLQIVDYLCADVERLKLARLSPDAERGSQVAGDGPTRNRQTESDARVCTVRAVSLGCVALKHWGPSRLRQSRET